MNSRRNNFSRAEEKNVNEAVPSQAPQKPQVFIEDGALSNVEIRVAINSLTQLLSTHVVGDIRV